MKHTPTPWHVISPGKPRGPGSPTIPAAITAEQSEAPAVRVLVEHRDGRDPLPDAEFIVLAVNAHDKFVALAHQAVSVALRRPHDGAQLDEDLEGLLLSANKALKGIWRPEP